MTGTISNEPLRNEVTRLLLDRLLSGGLQPGSRVNESQLAEELGVSRTPLREALLLLCFEGFLGNELGKGFHVLPLSPDTGRQLYAVAGDLEAIALEEVPHFGEAGLQEMDRLEEDRISTRAAGDFKLSVEIDNRWHQTLVRDSRNPELLRILDVVKRRLFLYEYVMADETGEPVGGDHDHHRLITSALRDGNRSLAVELVKHHWKVGSERRMAWLAARHRSENSRWTSLM